MSVFGHSFGITFYTGGRSAVGTGLILGACSLRGKKSSRLPPYAFFSSSFGNLLT